MAGGLDDDTISDADVEAGLFDASAVELWRVDWARPELRVRLWAGTLAFMLRYVRQQRELAMQQAERDALRDRRILELVKRVDHFQQSAVKVGDEVHELRASLAPLPDKFDKR